MSKLAIAVFFVALWNLGSSQERCRDIVAVIELKSSDRSSPFYAKVFMDKLRQIVEPDGNCNKLGFIFVWKVVESVVKLDCDYTRCYKEDGKKVAESIIQKIFKEKFEYNRDILVKGMNMAANQLRPAGFNIKDNTEKLLLLVLSNPSASSGPVIADQVKDYLDLGINISAIGVGSDSGDVLSNIATNKRYAIKVKSFRELSSHGATKIGDALQPSHAVFRTAVGEITKPLVGPSKEERKAATLKVDKSDPCTHIVDIAFLVDSSGSVKKYYEQEKFFVQRIASRFNIIEKGTHGGVVVFSSHGYIKTLIKFTDYLTTDSFNEAVDNLPFYGYMTRIDKALELAHRELYTAEGKARPNVKKLLFLITDGRQNPNNFGGVPIDPSKQSDKLHLGNVQIYAVGVGAKVNLTELQRITKDPRKVYSVRDFEELTSTAFVYNVSKQLCQGAVQATELPVTIKPKTNCSSKASCKCGECGCCGKKPVYVNIFQGSNNYVSQGQEVTQTGSGSSAGAMGPSGPLQDAKSVKGLSNEQIGDYIKSLIPYYDSMNKSLKELLARSLQKKSDGNILNKK